MYKGDSMDLINFPSLNLTLNISKVAFSVGNIDIYWYAICIVLGIVVSLILCSKTKDTFGINFEVLLEIIIYSLVFGLIGARLYYVIFRIDYYMNNLSQIFNVRDGGLAIYGGIICGALTAYIVCKKKRINAIDCFDYICPYLALAQAIGRWGNFFNIEAYGIETNNLFRMGVFSEFGYIEVHPCFLYESIACIMIFILLRIIQKNRKFEGQIVSLYLILYGIVRFIIEGIRSDSLMMFSFKISQIISIIFIIFGIYFISKKKQSII